MASGWVAAFAAGVVSQTSFSPIGAGNSLTLPAQRHVVRLATPNGPVWFLALQMDGANGHGLALFRSNDEGQTYSYDQPIQDDATERDTGDLQAVGPDMALVYSYEGPALSGSNRHDVAFQWWRFNGTDWTPQPAVLVFDSTSDATAYSRGELAIDSQGRIWVQAFFMNPDGSSTLVISVSTDGGRTFQRQSDLDAVPHRGGGRLLSLGSKLILLYGMHNGFLPARFTMRNDGDPVATWLPPRAAFPEGIYHGAALSAVADGLGGMHVVYKNENDERLYYRAFDGVSFGPAMRVDDTSDWALQPTTTRVGGDVAIYFNRMLATNNSYEMAVTWLHGGSLSPPSVITTAGDFKGYPGAPDVLPFTFPRVPCIYSETANAGVGGEERVLSTPNLSLSPGPPPQDAGPHDAGPSPDAGRSVDAGPGDGRDAGGPAADSGDSPPDAGPPLTDGGTGPTDSGGLPPPFDGGTPAVLFRDDFQVIIPPDDGLGSSWTLVSGLWFANGAADSDLDGANQAQENVATCSDCQVQAAVTSYGVEAGVFLRALATNPGTRYDIVLVTSGHVQVRRVQGGTPVVLGDAPSGLSELDLPATLTLTTQGSGPVGLSGAVNGKTLLTLSDASASAIATAGQAGLWTPFAGVPFNTFVLSTLGGSSPPSDAGGPDAGPPDAGGMAQDSGVPSARGQLALTVRYTDTGHSILAVDPAGTVYGKALGDSNPNLYASSDGHTWQLRGNHPAGPFWTMTALSNGTLLADVFLANGDHGLARSTDRGVTWSDVLDLGPYLTLSAHSFAELDGMAYVIEYQVFTTGSAPITLFASTDDGRTWSSRYVFQGHRHGHGLRGDLPNHALWVYFGDTDDQSGVYRSVDQGKSWTFLLGNQQGDVVDAEVLTDGSLLFGQDISFLPPTPHIANVSSTGNYVERAPLTGPSYSTHRVSSGGFIVGASRENEGDIYPSGEVSAHVFTSADGMRWQDALLYPRASSTDTARADVYWELPDGTLLLQLLNISGFGPGGAGYQILQPSLQ